MLDFIARFIRTALSGLSAPREEYLPIPVKAEPQRRMPGHRR